jgi:hypothetical protein
MDVDAKSKCYKAHDKVLAVHEHEKKKKYLEACFLGQRHRHFSPFVVSTDGLLGQEAKTLLKKKWEKSYSEVCGYVNA